MTRRTDAVARPGAPGRRRAAAAVLAALVVLVGGCRTGEGGDGGAGSGTTAPGRAGPPAQGSVEVEERAELPVPRTEVAGAVLGDRMVVVGGLLPDGTASAHVHFYDRGSDRWSEGPSLPTPAHHVGMASARNRVWVVGGFIGDPGGGWREVAEVWSLGPGEESWRAEPALAAPRGALAVAAVDGTLVAVGGVSGGGVVARTEVLRPGSGGWAPGPALRQAREHTAATTVGGRVHVIAGRVGSLESNLRTVESWDTQEAAWREEPPLQATRGGIAAAGACVAGGEEPGGTIASVECLGEDGWTVVAQLTRPRHGLAVVALGDDVHVVGGGEQPGLFVSGAHEVVTGAARRTASR